MEHQVNNFTEYRGDKLKLSTKTTPQIKTGSIHAASTVILPLWETDEDILSLFIVWPHTFAGREHLSFLKIFKL